MPGTRARRALMLRLTAACVALAVVVSTLTLAHAQPQDCQQHHISTYLGRVLVQIQPFANIGLFVSA